MLKVSSYNHVTTFAKLKQFLPETTSLFEHTYINPLNGFKGQKFHTALKSLNEFSGIETYLSLSKYRELYKNGIITESALKRTVVTYNSRTVDDWMHLMLDEKVVAPNHNKDCFQKSLIKHLNLNLKQNIQPKLFRIISGYLNQNLSGARFPVKGIEFFKALAIIEKDSLISFFKSKSVRDLLFEKKLVIENLLAILVGNEKFYEKFLFEIAFSHVGYSSLVVSIEKHPARFIQNVKITLEDFIKLELLLILDELDFNHKNNWKVLSELLEDSNKEIDSKNQSSLYFEILEIWQESLENSIFDSFKNKVSDSSLSENKENKLPAMQAIFCYEDNHLANSMCSSNDRFRPYFYYGHLGLKFLYKVPENGFNLTYAPLDDNTDHVLQGNSTTNAFSTGNSIKKVVHNVYHLISGNSNFYNPMEVIHFDVELPEVLQNESKKDLNFKIGFTLNEIAQIVRELIETLSIDLGYSEIIYLVGHSDTSDKLFNHFNCECGCSSGKSNILNVRLFAKMANDSRVRDFLLAAGFDLGNTYFIPVFHTQSKLTCLDYENLNSEIKSLHNSTSKYFNYKLHSKNIENSIAKSNMVLNNVVYIGKFQPHLIENINYITYNERNDTTGEALKHILKEASTLLLNKSLAYYLSLTDKYSISSGDESAISTEGLLGVSNFHGEDLKIGLSEQQLKNHLPLRPLILIEFEDENKIKNTINEVPDFVEHAKNGWIRLKMYNVKTKVISAWKV